MRAPFGVVLRFVVPAALLLQLGPAAQRAVAQQSAAGVELRAYPAGLIPTVRGEWSLAPRTALLVSVGYNATNRRSWGEHDHERGGGPGIGLGLDYTRRHDRLGWRFGVRADLWTLGIHWREDGGSSGTTRVWVFQPTARVAHAWPIGGGWAIEGSSALGAELNIRTRGEAVGHGAILLLGVAVLGHF